MTEPLRKLSFSRYKNRKIYSKDFASYCLIDDLVHCVHEGYEVEVWDVIAEREISQEIMMRWLATNFAKLIIEREGLGIQDLVALLPELRSERVSPIVKVLEEKAEQQRIYSRNRREINHPPKKNTEWTRSLVALRKRLSLPIIEKKQRYCLGCREEFKSFSRGNRMCQCCVERAKKENSPHPSLHLTEAPFSHRPQEEKDMAI